MSQKSILLSVFSILALVLAAGFASAATLDDFTITPSVSNIAHNGGSFTLSFTLKNTGADGNITLSSSSTSGSWSIAFSPSSPIYLIANQSTTVTGTVTFAAQQSGSLAGIITADPVGAGSPKNASFSVAIDTSQSMSMASTQTLTETQNGILTITNNGNTAFTNINLTTSGDFNVSLSTTNFALSPGASRTVTVTSITNLSALKTEVGTYSTTITAKDIVTSTTASYTYAITGDFCDRGNINASAIKITDVEDRSSDTENEWEWKPLDNVEIEVEVGNELGDDEDFVVELGFFDSVDKEFLEIDGEDSLEQEISLDDGDSETISFEFQVPVEVEESNGRYVLYIKTYVDGDEDAVCNSYDARNIPSGSAKAIEIKQENNDVVLDEITAPEVVTAGDTITISAKVFNIGTDDESKTRVVLSNTKLGLKLESEGFDLDSGDSDEIDLSFVIPFNVEDGIYTFKLSTEFDYSKSSDAYRKDSEDTWEVKVKVVGGTNVSTSPTAGQKISVALDSDEPVNPGSEMTVRVTLRNTESAKATYVIGAKDYADWAALSSVSDRIVTLEPGATKEVQFNFEVNDDAEAGEHTFIIETITGSKTETKEVAVNVEQSSLWSSFANLFGDSKKSLIWVFAIVNIILLVIIIIFWIRISRR